MIRLLLADTERLVARRMTKFFPGVLALLMVAGVVIAYAVIQADDGTPPDFVNDIAGGVDASSLLGPVATLLPVMAFVIGASFVGADLKSGMLEQLLTWEPRRLRVTASRSISGFVVVGAVAALLAAFFVALMFGLGVALRTADGIPGELWTNVAEGVGRTAIACGLFAMLGVGITLLVNNSVGSIVGFLIYWFILENFLISAFLPKVAVWLPIVNGSAFAAGSDVEYIEGSVFSANADFELVRHHGPAAAALVLVAWAVAGLAAGGYRLARADID